MGQDHPTAVQNQIPAGPVTDQIRTKSYHIISYHLYLILRVPVISGLIYGLKRWPQWSLRRLMPKGPRAKGTERK